MAENAFRSAAALVEKMARGETSSHELLDHSQERLGRPDPGIDAVITRDAERERLGARSAPASAQLMGRIPGARGTRAGPR